MYRLFYISIMQIILCIAFVGAAFGSHYEIPERTEDNIIIASYNIQQFGQADHDMGKLAKVIKYFDVCGILEVKEEAEVATLAAALKSETGKEWGYVYGVKTHRPRDIYYEAYAAVWRKDRALLGDGVISNIQDLNETYKHDPFLVSFKRMNFDFTLLLVHIRPADDADGTKAEEVRSLVDLLRSLRGYLPERDIIMAGTFYYSGTDKVLTTMAEDADLIRIDPNAKTTISKTYYTEYSESYDHIFISELDTTEFMKGQSKALDAAKLIYGLKSKADMKKAEKELSDHIPVWATFDVSTPDDD